MHEGPERSGRETDLAEIEVTNAKDLLAALTAAEGGEVITAQGAFGGMKVEGIRPARPVIIRGDLGAHFESILLRNCANLQWTGLSCWPVGAIKRLAGEGGGGKAIPYLFLADERSSGIEISRSLFRGRKDSDGHTNWSREDWFSAKTGAVALRGERGVIRSNKAIGVYHGFAISGRASEMYDNNVWGFAADGMRVNNDNCVVIANRVADAVNIDGNHPDGLQAFKTDGLMQGLVIKDNVILEWTIRPNNPLRKPLQGIGLHNGPYQDVVIRGNRIASSSANGIRVNRTVNVEVTGNIARHVDGVRGNRPRIWLSNCSGRIVSANNQAEKFVPPGGPGNREPDYSVKF